MDQKYVKTAAYYLAFILLGLTSGAEGPHFKPEIHPVPSVRSASMFFGSLGYLLALCLAADRRLRR
jgi:hypothetical protein